jgi:hypothetical protein
MSEHVKAPNGGAAIDAATFKVGEHAMVCSVDVVPVKWNPEWWLVSYGLEPPTVHIPRHIAAAIIDAVGWMVDEGQTFEDQQAGKELMAHIAATYPDLVPDWMER